MEAQLPALPDLPSPPAYPDLPTPLEEQFPALPDLPADLEIDPDCPLEVDFDVFEVLQALVEGAGDAEGVPDSGGGKPP